MSKRVRHPSVNTVSTDLPYRVTGPHAAHCADGCTAVVKQCHTSGIHAIGCRSEDCIMESSGRHPGGGTFCRALGATVQGPP
jgi:hypothetical protein